VTDASGSVHGIPLRQFEEIDSTNEEARRLALAGVEGPLWLVADRQTKGRGRRGREWQSQERNLAATLLLKPKQPFVKCAQLSFVAALSAGDLIGRFATGSDIKLKWPNDVLADEKKIAGILLESASNNGTRPDWLAVGFGVNLASHPAETEFPATSIVSLGAKPPAPREALECLGSSWSKWHGLWAEWGFEPIRDAWLARAARLGTRIRARLADVEIVGIFEGIDAEGALILREGAHRTRRISAGEVFF
jgi:BirA family biotin operon repressor/biotin-[acetyl-CoA-carboxylase] ligase